MRYITNETLRIPQGVAAAALQDGYNAALPNRGAHCLGQLRRSRKICAAIRAEYGFKSTHSPLLTPPSSQHKLDKSAIPAYGLTLHHYVFKPLHGSTVNLCPSAGDCTRVCVINNGNGRFSVVQRGWRWRTELLLRNPYEFFVLLGYELQMAVQRARWDNPSATPAILVRPNVNSDIEWEKIVPHLVDGWLFGDDIMFYGYSKHASVLEGNGWLAPQYRVAYSWNEKSPPWGKALDFLAQGGNVAVVTDRKYTSRTREPIKQWAPQTSIQVVDADESDEWILTDRLPGVIGDLAFKPATTELRRFGQTSDFVTKIYHREEEDDDG